MEALTPIVVEVQLLLKPLEAANAQIRAFAPTPPQQWTGFGMKRLRALDAGWLALSVDHHRRRQSAPRRTDVSALAALQTKVSAPSERPGNMCSMTSDGSPYTRFRRALETGNELLVVATAKELPQVGLEDALSICLVFRDGDPDRYERAAVRWLGRFALEARGVSIVALRMAADALDALPERPPEAMERLQAICTAHGIK